MLKLHNNHHCLYCNSNKIKKNGKALGKYPQFKCNNCKKNYSIRTNTIFFHTRKSIQLWQEYIELFSQGLALRKIVEKMDNKINEVLLKQMRHFLRRAKREAEMLKEEMREKEVIVLIAIQKRIRFVY